MKREFVPLDLVIVTFVIAMSVATLGAGAAHSQDGAWIPMPPATDFVSAGAIYDPIRDRMLVYGGTERYGGLRSDTWTYELNGDSIVDVVSTRGPTPPGRSDPSVTYDSRRDRMLVFGGAEASTNSDVWALDLGTNTWSMVVAAGTPPDLPRYSTSAYDPVRDRLLVFTANASVTSVVVWQLEFGDTTTPTPTWSQVPAAGTPPANGQGMRAFYDAAGDRILTLNPTFYSSTVATHQLSLSGTATWAVIAGNFAPANESGGAVGYDPVGNRLILHGGFYSDGTPKPVFHILHLSAPVSWQHHPSPGPVETAHSVVYDPIRDRLLLVNGWYSFSRTPGSSERTPLPPSQFKFATNSWGPDPFPQPPARCWSAGIYDPADHRVVIFGGAVRYSPSLNDVWELRLDGRPHWKQIVASGSVPPAQSCHAAVLDPLRHRMVVLGGDSESRTKDVWCLDLTGSNTWTHIVPAGSAGGAGAIYARTNAVYDPAGDRIIVVNADTTFALPLSGTPAWSVLHTAAPLQSPLIVYDSQAGRVLAVGYANGTTQTWSLVLTPVLAWSQIPTAGISEPGYYENIAFDPINNRVVLHGLMDDGNGGAVAEIRVLEDLQGSPTWRRLAPTGTAPSYREGSAGFFDSQADRLILSGGTRSLGLGVPATYGSTSSMNFSGGPLAVDLPEPSRLSLAAPFPNPTYRGATFVLELPAAGKVQATVFDVTGRAVRTLTPGFLPPGRHPIVWDGRTTEGARAPAGLYFCRVEGAGRTTRRTVVLLP